MIQPIWFIYDNESSKIYVDTQKTTRKFQNIRRNLDKIYFSIDDENFPYKGVKGRAIAKISEDIQRNLPIVEKINLKYLGTIEHPLAKMIMENTKHPLAKMTMLRFSMKRFTTSSSAFYDKDVDKSEFSGQIHFSAMSRMSLVYYFYQRTY